MAKWIVNPETANNAITSTVEYDNIDGRGGETEWSMTQHNIDAIKEEVKRDKEMLNSGGKKEMGYRKMCTVPDVVAVEILTKHNLDIHDQFFMENPANLKRLKYIIQTEYPYLLVST